MRCSVHDDECVTGRLKLGMCEKHYRRQRAHGTTASTRLNAYSQYSVNEDGCWMWTGAVWRNGYGKPSTKLHDSRLAHRVFYTEHVGPIPPGRDLDHKCHNADSSCRGGVDCPHRRCVNPSHLEPTSRHTNLTRAIAARLVCRNGIHDLTLPGSVKKGSIAECTECWRIRYRAGARRYRAKKLQG